MKILIATFRYLSLTGSETFTYQMVKSLQEKGMKVFLYSPFLAGQILKETQKLKIPLTDNLKDYKKEKFDLIHCHHNLTSILVRRYFPSTPLIYLMHGPQVFLEQAPEFIKFNYYGGVSEEIYKILEKKNIDKKKIFLFPNSVDTKRFRPSRAISVKPAKLLVLSHRVSRKFEETVLKLGQRLDLKVSFAGSQRALFKIEEEINKADLVISLGRGIIESLSCGRAALVFGHDNLLYSFGDGMVTGQNIKKLARKNFSGRTKKITFNLENLEEEIQRYHPSMGKFNRQYVLAHFDIEKNIERLIRIYKKAIKEQAEEFDENRVDFMSQALEEIIGHNKLLFANQDLKKIILDRVKNRHLKKWL